MRRLFLPLLRLSVLAPVATLAVAVIALISLSAHSSSTPANAPFDVTHLRESSPLLARVQQRTPPVKEDRVLRGEHAKQFLEERLQKNAPFAARYQRHVNNLTEKGKRPSGNPVVHLGAGLARKGKVGLVNASFAAPAFDCEHTYYPPYAPEPAPEEANPSGPFVRESRRVDDSGCMDDSFSVVDSYETGVDYHTGITEYIESTINYTTGGSDSTTVSLSYVIDGYQVYYNSADLDDAIISQDLEWMTPDCANECADADNKWKNMECNDRGAIAWHITKEAAKVVAVWFWNDFWSCMYGKPIISVTIKYCSAVAGTVSIAVGAMATAGLYQEMRNACGGRMYIPTPMALPGLPPGQRGPMSRARSTGRRRA